MSSHTAESLRQMLSQAEALPYGNAKDALLAEVLRHAEAEELPRLAFDARLQQVSAFAGGMARDQVFEPFQRCLDVYDKNPSKYGQSVERQVLRAFKQVIATMTRLPEIPLERLRTTLEEMAWRFEHGQYSPHAVYQTKYHVDRHLGGVAAASRWYRLWVAARRDELSDCVACDAAGQVTHLAAKGRDVEAIEVGEPALAGPHTCHKEPQSLLTALLLPFARTGRAADARSAHRKAYRVLRTQPLELNTLAKHIEFCARTGNEARGMELLERHIGWLDSTPTPYHAMRFAASGALLLRLAAESDATMTVQRPAHGDRVAEELPVADLGAQLTEQAVRIAGLFDERNGTTHQTEAVRALIDAEPVADHIPLSITSVRRPAPVGTSDAEWAGLSTLEVIERGEASLARTDDVAAEAALRRLTELADESDPVLFGRTLELRGRLHRAGAEADFRHAAELFAAAGDERRGQALLSRLGLLLCELKRPDEGMPLVRAAVSHFQEVGDAESEAWTSVRLANALVMAGEIDEARRMLDHAASLPVHDELLPGFIAWARTDLCGDDLDAALDATTAALTELRRSGATRMVAVASIRLSGLWRAKGDPERGLTAAEEAVACVPAISSSGLSSTLLAAHGDVLVELDRASLAVPVIAESVGYALDAAEPYLVATTRRSLANACRAAGQLQDAADVADEAILGFEAVGDHESANGVRYVLAGIQSQLGDHDAALAVYDDMVVASRAHNDLGSAAEILTESADLLDKLDRDAEAATRYRAAGDAAAAADDPYRVAYCRYQEALSLQWSDKSAEALAVLAEAEQVVANLPDDDPEAKLWHEARMATNAVRILRAADRIVDAIASAERAITVFSQVDEPSQVTGAQLMLGQLLIEAGQVEAAASLLRGALAAVTTKGGKSPRISQVLAIALDKLGRTEEAAEVRATAGVDQR
ncbi:MAG TPA: tetratricopeptide repeat protein [Pseudonocardiaceae bacterium]|nr:tetratricopeptide repeat protein [Pseudonocardiaceae bacterium]